MVAKHLLGAAISLLSGLASSQVHCKAIIPALDLNGWLLILVTAQAVPIYAALLAIFQQILGDYYLAGSFICIVLVLSVGILTGLNITKCKPNPLEEFHAPLSEHVLMVVLVAGLVGFLSVWAAGKDVELVDVQGYIKDTFGTPDIICFVFADFLYRKIVTAVAGTDATLHAFVQAEAWRKAVDHEGKEAHSVAVHDLALLWHSSVENKEQQEAAAQT
eukprot:gnl/MRDRNA2_/MRDRNA2_177833_c0_seq1.p1 gnl/MRDRNA2_/MRDRNA2_177833_c0~~gnl/MRDRNA2_/MRDRNA2_177833_c0_seq1.p1  ORF type:complete len:225 (+),score=42.62 gnl/MRDRNA2_/MRDRNA2_177833_c0_seq1:24-677(+)